MQKDSPKLFRIGFDGAVENRVSLLKLCQSVADVVSFHDYGSSLEEAFVSLIKNE